MDSSRCINPFNRDLCKRPNRHLNTRRQSALQRNNYNDLDEKWYSKQISFRRWWSGGAGSFLSTTTLGCWVWFGFVSSGDVYCVNDSLCFSSLSVTVSCTLGWASPGWFSAPQSNVKLENDSSNLNYSNAIFSPALLVINHVSFNNQNFDA